MLIFGSSRWVVVSLNPTCNVAGSYPRLQSGNMFNWPLCDPLIASSMPSRCVALMMMTMMTTTTATAMMMTTTNKDSDQATCVFHRSPLRVFFPKSTVSRPTVSPGNTLRVCYQFTQGRCSLTTCPRAHPGEVLQQHHPG